MKRSYDMRSRAEAAEATRVKIMDAAVELFMERDWAGMTLDAVARRAGVTLQTVLRRFGSKAGLVAAAAEYHAPLVEKMREPPAAGGVPAAIHTLADCYEQMGDLSWRLLCAEAEPAIHAVLERARSTHRAWLEQVFAEVLPSQEAEREERLSQLFCATDFYLWKLQRRDLGRSRQEAERVMHELVAALLERFARDSAEGAEVE